MDIKTWIKKIRYKIFPIVFNWQRDDVDGIRYAHILYSDTLQEFVLRMHHIHNNYMKSNFYHGSFADDFHMINKDLNEMDRCLVESEMRIKNYYFLSKPKIEREGIALNYLIRLKNTITNNIEHLEKSIVKKVVKRVYSPVDPYGEENWEE